MTYIESNVHPIRTLQEFAKGDMTENIAVDEIARNLHRFTTKEIAMIFVRLSGLESTRSK